MKFRKGRRVEWMVIKRIRGVGDGEWDEWDGPFDNEAQARRCIERRYEGTGDFAVMRITFEKVLPQPKVKS